jgi:hypothetical protein
MANSRYWRRPGRRDEERERFNRLMRKLERYRLREGITKRELARRLRTSEAAIHYCSAAGRSVARLPWSGLRAFLRVEKPFKRLVALLADFLDCKIAFRSTGLTAGIRQNRGNRWPGRERLFGRIILEINQIKSIGEWHVVQHSGIVFSRTLLNAGLAIVKIRNA